MTTTFEVLQLVLEERARQDAKWGQQNHQMPVFLAILTEEVGELAQAILADELGATEHSSHSQDIETEAVEVAASAVLLVEALRRGAAATGDQKEGEGAPLGWPAIEVGDDGRPVNPDDLAEQKALAEADAGNQVARCDAEPLRVGLVWGRSAHEPRA